MMVSVWRVEPVDSGRASALAGALGVRPLTGQLLLNRGLMDPDEGARFLEPRLESLEPPDALPDLAKAARRIRRAIAAREPILIFGDSDVDGLSASALLHDILRRLGATVSARQSNRIADGYGLPSAMAQGIARSPIRLLILVDCGTNQPAEVEMLAARGVETIIVDHHVPLPHQARPHAFVNPHASPGGPGQELCSAGLAFKLAQRLLDGASSKPLLEAVDLAALGTLADCVPLIGDNRVIVACGLPRILSSRRAGLRGLCEATRTRSASAEHVLKRLIPRLNAGGRLGAAEAPWRLLSETADGRMEHWMREAEAAHETTKRLHRQVMSEAHDELSRLHFKDQYVMVVSRTGWHPGLMGPLAAQLAQQYGRPAIAIALDGRRGVGSGRSIPRFNLLDALRACERVLMRFGGHAQACGLTVDRTQLDPFRLLVNQHARHAIGPAGLTRTRVIDLELPLQAIDPEWVLELERLAPFGAGNPRPTILVRRLAYDVRSPRVGELSDGTCSVAARGGVAGLVQGRWYDVVATPAIVAGRLTLMVRDAKDAAAPSEPGPTAGTPYRHAPA